MRCAASGPKTSPTQLRSAAGTQRTRMRCHSERVDALCLCFGLCSSSCSPTGCALWRCSNVLVELVGQGDQRRPGDQQASGVHGLDGLVAPPVEPLTLDMPRLGVPHIVVSLRREGMHREAGGEAEIEE